MPAVAERADALRVEYASAEVKNLKAVGTLEGVSVLFVAGRNGVGTGTIRNYADGTIAWKAPGSSNWGEAVDVSAGGSFVLEDGDDADKYIRVQVATTYLPSSPINALVITAEEFNESIGGDTVSAAEASAGSVESWSVELVNASTRYLSDLRVWLDPATADLEIGWNGADWYAPDSEAHADVLMHVGIAPAASLTLHLRRTIGAAANADPEVLNVLQFAWNSL